jgi:uncharacterized protein (TIGR03437 family)
MKHSCHFLILALLALGTPARAASTLYAATGYGPYKSTDSGSTWKQILVPPINPTIATLPFLRTLFIDPATPSTVYSLGATSTFGSNILIKSTDAAQTWSSFPEPDYLRNSEPDSFAIDPVTTNVMYVNAVLNGVMKSADSGLTWTQLTIVKPNRSPSGPAGVQPSIATVSTDPHNTGVVYALGPGTNSSGGNGYLLKSSDYGSTWSIVAETLDFSGRIYVDPVNSQVLYGSNTRGLFGSCPKSPTSGIECGLYKSSDGGQSWTPLGLPATAMSSLAFDATPGVLYAGTTPATITPTVMTSRDGGNTWTTVLQGTLVATPTVRADPSAPSTVFAMGIVQNTIHKSTDAGAHWTAVLLPQACDKVVNPICAHAPGLVDFLVAPPASAPPPPPAISANGVVSGASFKPGVAANSWVTITGTNLASQTGDWSNAVVNGKLPTTLNGVSVSMGGKAAYVYFTSPGQLNVLAPDVSPGPVTITVTTAGGTSSAFTATASQYGPAFFTWPDNQVVATRQDFSFAVKAGTFPGATTVAAKPGDVIILWATGFGPTNPAAPAGVAVPGDQTYATATAPVVTINGTPAIMFGAALAPGAAGLYQVAIQLPNTLADGDYPIQASIGGVPSPTGTILSVHQ